MGNDLQAELDAIYKPHAELLGAMQFVLLPLELELGVAAERAIEVLGLQRVPQREISFSPIAVKDFAGPWWDAENQRLRLEKTERITHDMGFAFAFAWPLSKWVEQKWLDDDALQALHARVCSLLFGHFKDDLEIFRWSQDWNADFSERQSLHPYFWMARNKTRDVLIVAASDMNV